MTLETLSHPTLIWFVAGLLLFLFELMAPTFILLFFGIGAWIVAAIRFFTPVSLNTQLFLFIIISMITLIILRRSFKKIFHGYIGAKQDPDHNLSEFAGQKAVVKVEITPQMAGKVEYHGTLWNAESTHDIPAESIVEIVGKNNITLKVKKIQKGE